MKKLNPPPGVELPSPYDLSRPLSAAPRQCHVGALTERLIDDLAANLDVRYHHHRGRPWVHAFARAIHARIPKGPTTA